MREISDQDRAAYHKLLPKLLDCCKHWQRLRDESCVSEEALESLAKRLAVRAGNAKNVPPARLQVIRAHDQSKGAAVVLHGARGDDSSKLTRLPCDLVENILDMACHRSDGSVTVQNYTEGCMELSKICVLVRCPRPYNQGPVLVPNRLEDFPAEFGWQDWSNTTWTDPLRGLADELIHLLVERLPGVFRDEDVTACDC
jgi:hypothetical protein